MRDFENIEAELGLQVGDGIFGVGDDVAVFAAQVRIENRDGAIHGDGVAVVVGGVVSERAEREGVFVEILGVAEKRADKIGGTNVVDDVAE